MPTPPLDAAVLRASIDAVNRNGGNVAAAARELGISRTTLQARVQNERFRSLCDAMPGVTSNTTTRPPARNLPTN